MFLLKWHLRGDHLEQLGFAACQTVVQCLISHVAITGAQGAISCLFPFACASQAYPSLPSQSERMVDHGHQVRLADREAAPKTMRPMKPTRHQKRTRRQPWRYCASAHDIRELGKKYNALCSCKA
jgi:hypothetical protein